MLESMLRRYNLENINDFHNALREILQEIALAGLYRGGFFDKTAFYGDTCLRLFYDLDRFSEDLDFLENKIATLDVESVKIDIRRFIKDKNTLDIWSRDYFLELSRMMKINNSA